MKRAGLAGILAKACLAVFVILAGCGSPSGEDIGQIIADAQRCSGLDRCVLAGANRCRCRVPVNASHADRVDQAASEEDCGTAVVKCALLTNVRCEQGKCTADNP